MENGKTVIEKLNTSFTTGKAPDYIPMKNVLYSYPMPMMFNYYQNETPIGYVQLNKGQSYLFISNPGVEWKQVGRFTDKQGIKKDFAFTYIEAEKKISFTRPANLKNNTIYTFDLVKVPVNGKTVVDKNVTDKVETTNVKAAGQEDFSTVEITTQDAEGNIAILQEKNIFSISFRTSLYNTLSAKIDKLNKNEGRSSPLRPFVDLIYIGIGGGEIFDKYEMQGDLSKEINPTIQFVNVLDDAWYKAKIYPYLYKNYPLDNSSIRLTRTIDPVGIQPINTIKIFILKAIKNLSENEIFDGIVDPSLGPAAFHSYFVHYCNIDYIDIVAQVSNKYRITPTTNTSLQFLINTPFPPVGKGKYNFKVNYILPGINLITSTKQMSIILE